jgi:hypothetical protein
VNSGTESFGSARFGLRRFFFAILGRSGGFERTEKTGRDAGYFIHCGLERGLIRLRWFGESTDFSHELQRGSLNFLGSNRGIEVEERFDISAHLPFPQVTASPIGQGYPQQKSVVVTLNFLRLLPGVTQSLRSILRGADVHRARERGDAREILRD